MRKYRVQISAHRSDIVTARTAIQAKAKVWNEIKNTYTFGFENWIQFNKGTKAKRIK